MHRRVGIVTARKREFIKMYYLLEERGYVYVGTSGIRHYVNSSR